MRKLLIVISAAMFFCSCSSNNISNSTDLGTGYKDLKWGETVEQIKNRVKDLTEGETGGFFNWNKTILYTMKYLFPDVKNLKIDKAGKSSYYSDSRALRLFFSDNKLAGVNIYNNDNADKADEFNILTGKYGAAKTIPITSSYMGLEGNVDVAVWDNKTNLVVWEKWALGGVIPYEYVSYIDGQWFHSLENKINVNNNSKQADSGSAVPK